MNDKATLIKEYQQLAPHYEKRWHNYLRKSSQKTLEVLARCPHFQTLLDVGCGTGFLLGQIAQRYAAKQLFGVEPVAAMLNEAQKKLSSHVHLQQAWAERLPFADDSMDVVVSCSAFHYFPEPMQALGEIRRVLRPAGSFILNDWCSDYLSMRLLASYLRWRGRAYERIYSQQNMLELLEKTGFQIESLQRYQITPLWGMMCLRAVKHNHAPKEHSG